MVVLAAAVALLCAVVRPCSAVNGAPDDMEKALKGLMAQTKDFKPRVIIDCGANEGMWAKMIRNIFPDSRIVMLEALPMLEGPIKEVIKAVGNAEYKITALGDKKEEVSFYMGTERSANLDTTKGSSMFQENTKFFANVKPTKMTALPLDDIIAERGHFGKLDMLKLDVQGAEIKVLKGATKVLQEVTFVLLEVSTVKYNAGGACYHEVDEFLRKKGFAMYDILDVTRMAPYYFKTPGTAQFDQVWVRQNSPLVKTFDKGFMGFCTMEGKASSGCEGVLKIAPNGRKISLSPASLAVIASFIAIVAGKIGHTMGANQQKAHSPIDEL